MCVYMLSRFSRVGLFATQRMVACQAPLSMGFSRQEYWSEFPCPPPGDLPDPGIKPTSFMSPALQEDSLPLASAGKPSLLVSMPNSVLFIYRMDSAVPLLMDIGLLQFFFFFLQ